METGIYCLECKITGKKYVGSTKKSFKWRKWKHFNQLNKGINSKYLQEDFNKYGEENFEFIIIEECNIEEIKVKESYWIKKLNSIYPNGYNIAPGYSNKGLKWNDEMKSKHSQRMKGINKGNKHTEEYKKQRSEKYKGSGNPNFGKETSLDVKIKQSIKKGDITIDDCKEIKKLLIKGLNTKQILEIFNNKFSDRIVYRIRQGKHWSSEILGGGFKDW